MISDCHIVEPFLNYIRYEKHYSLHTVISYGEDLRQFEDYVAHLDEGLSWDDVDADIIRNWIEHQMDNGHSPSSVNRQLCALRSMYRHAFRHGLVSHNPVRMLKGPKTSKPLPSFLKEKEINQLLDSCPWEDTFKDQRDRTIIMLFYSTGVRLSEAVKLNDNDIDLNRRKIRVTGKGNKQRIIPFADEMAHQLQAYISRRNHDIERTDNAFLLSEKGKRMTAGQVGYMVRTRIKTVTTQRKCSPHTLRHTFATAMMNNNAGIETVRSLLGHESVRTTTIYTHTTFEQLKNAYNQAHPRKKKNCEQNSDY